MASKLLKVFIITDMYHMENANKFVKFVKDKGEIDIKFIGPYSDIESDRSISLLDAMNHTDVCIFLPEIYGKNDRLYFQVGVAYANNIPIIGVGPGFCNESFLLECGEFKDKFVAVQNVFESEEDFQWVLSKIVVATN